MARRSVAWLACLASLVLVAGCASFKLGTVAYIPHGQVGTVSVAPPGAAASAAK